MDQPSTTHEEIFKTTPSPHLNAFAPSTGIVKSVNNDLLVDSTTLGSGMTGNNLQMDSTTIRDSDSTGVTAFINKPSTTHAEIFMTTPSPHLNAFAPSMGPVLNFLYLIASLAFTFAAFAWLALSLLPCSWFSSLPCAQLGGFDPSRVLLF